MSDFDYVPPGQQPPITFPEPDNTIPLAQLALGREQFEWTKQQAEERKRNIADAMAAVNEVFAGRDPIYRKLGEEALDLNQSYLSDLYDDAARQQKFALARAGTTFGSVGADKNRELAKRMALGTSRVQQFAKGMEDQARARDEDMKSAYLGLATTGNIGGEIRPMASSTLRNTRATPIYMQGLQNTFSGLTQGIGGANSRNPIPGGNPFFQQSGAV